MVRSVATGSPVVVVDLVVVVVVVLGRSVHQYSHAKPLDKTKLSPSSESKYIEVRVALGEHRKVENSFEKVTGNAKPILSYHPVAPRTAIVCVFDSFY